MMLSASCLDRFGISVRSWTAIACLVLSVLSAAFGSEDCNTLDRVTNAIHLAQILYPELKGKELNLQFSAGGGLLSGPFDSRSVLITVDKSQWHPPSKTNEQPGRTSESGIGGTEIDLPIYLEFSFAESIIGKTGDVVGTEVSCQPVKFINNKASQQIREAAEVINAHPEWTDEQDLEAARKLGMRFGPEKKADLLRMLPLKDLSGIYGPLQVTAADFKTATLKEPGASFASLHWFIRAKRRGSEKTLAIMVEPFHGRIISISE
jgi:hypothetical protein